MSRSKISKGLILVVTLGCGEDNAVTAFSRSEARAPEVGALADDMVSALHRCGLRHYSEIEAIGVEEVAHRSGLDQSVVAEILQLAPLLDTGMPLPMVNRLAQAGISRPEEYYALDLASQKALEPEVPFGVVPFMPPERDPDLPQPACYDLEPPANEQAARRPFIRWAWYGPNGAETIDTSNHPWKNAASGRVVPERYPDPLEWDLLGYDLGRQGVAGPWGEFGYLLFHHRLTGVLRLFVYYPRNVSGYDALIAQLDVADAGAPGVTTPDGAPQMNYTLFPTPTTGGAASTAVVWANGVTGRVGAGSWLYADIPTLYDRRMDDAMRGGALLAVRVTLSGQRTEDVQLLLDGQLTAAGRVVPAAQQGPNLETMSGIVSFVGQNGGAIASAAKSAFKSDWLGFAQNLAGLVSGLFSGGPSPSTVTLAGRFSGTARGLTIQRANVSYSWFLLEPSATISNQYSRDSVLRQRCPRTRIGTVGYTNPSAFAPTLLAWVDNQCSTEDGSFQGEILFGARLAGGCPVGGGTARAEGVNPWMSGLVVRPGIGISLVNQQAVYSDGLTGDTGQWGRSPFWSRIQSAPQGAGSARIHWVAELSGPLATRASLIWSAPVRQQTETCRWRPYGSNTTPLGWRCVRQ